MQLDHVAVLVPDLALALDHVQALGVTTDEPAEFAGEGTREAYCGPAAGHARLLLIAPLGAQGPYARALRRRGPGLHHIALRVAALEAAPGLLPGWLLHPTSLTSRRDVGTLWFARPGVGALLEVQAGGVEGAPSIRGVGVEVDAGLERLLGPLGPLGVVAASAAHVTLGEGELPVATLWSDRGSAP